MNRTMSLISGSGSLISDTVSYPDSGSEAILNSTINLHYLQSGVILEDQNKSCVIIYSQPDQEQPLKFSVFPSIINQDFIKVNRELQVPIYGTLGLVKLLSGWFIVVIIGQVIVGHIEHHEIYLATKFAIYPIPVETNITEEEKKIQGQFLSTFLSSLHECNFYYSATYDITHSQQRIAQFTKEEQAKSLWERADQRFLWNKHIMTPFVEHGITDWILPVIDGFIEINRCFTFDATIKYSFALISRRECYRTGSRYQTRGADPQGHVANFAETEQIIEVGGNVSSWVQTRGSIPFIWYQLNSLKPKPTVDYSPFSTGAFVSHITEQLKRYGKQVLVSLINQKGIEQEVGDEYETFVKLFNSSDIRYIAFDFHEECKNNNFSNTQILLNLIRDDIAQNRYFLKDNNGTVLNEQVGNVRTNCIDCLDRTNVAQSCFGRYMLKEQLANLGILSREQEFDAPLVKTLNHIWANNADTLSKRYTGVGALKTDFTRTGKRSAKGAVADGVKSVTRLYHSTFTDETKQDTTEFLLGKLHLERYSHVFNASDRNRITYRVLKKTSWDDKGKNALLQLNFVNFTLITYYIESAVLKEYHISHIRQVVRYAKKYCSLALLVDTTAVSKKLSFHTPDEREQCLIDIDRIRTAYRTTTTTTTTQSSSQPSLSPLLPSSPSIHAHSRNSTGNYNNTTITHVHTNTSSSGSGSGSDSMLSLFPSVPTGTPGVGVGVGVPGSGESPKIPPRPPPPVKSTEESIRVYIGSVKLSTIYEPAQPQFELSIPKDRDLYVIGCQYITFRPPKEFYFSAIAFWCFSIRQYLGMEFEVVRVASVTNKLATIVLVRRQMVFRVNNIEVHHAVMVAPKVESQPSKGYGGYGGFGSLLKTITSEVKKISIADTDRSVNPNDIVAQAITFHMNETSLCFVNCTKAALPMRITEVDIFNHFQHVFYFGDVEPVHLTTGCWIKLCDDYNFGGIFWRSLLNPNLESIIGPKDMLPSQPIPVNVCFNLKTLIHLPQRATKKARITVHDITGDDLSIGDRHSSNPRLLSPYVNIHAPFLVRNVQTNAKYNTWSPQYEDILVLQTVITYEEYLSSKYLILTVHDQSDNTIIGSGIINLKPVVDHCNTLQDFVCRLTAFDEPRGVIKGKIGLTFDVEEPPPQNQRLSFMPTTSSPLPPPVETYAEEEPLVPTGPLIGELFDLS